MDSHEDKAIEFDLSEFCIRMNDFIRYLEAVGMKIECPHCGTDKGWSLYLSDKVNNDCLNAALMSFAESDLFRPIFAMSCLNCGSIRTIDAPHVMNWLKKDSEEAGSE